VEQNTIGGCGCCGAPDEVGFGSVERRHEVLELTTELAAEGHLRRSSIRISCVATETGQKPRNKVSARYGVATTRHRGHA
jgi:hypothetical protein